MTAGHCVDNDEDLRDKLSVRCGEWDTQNEDERLPYQERKVNRVQVRLSIKHIHHIQIITESSILFKETPRY